MAHEHQRECAGPRSYVKTRRVDECRTMDELFLYCLPAFGGAYLRRIYQILDTAIGMGCPLTLAVSGPVTVSGQQHTWLLSRRSSQPRRLQIRPRPHSRSLDQ
jgi:deoxyhypusine synthase